MNVQLTKEACNLLPAPINRLRQSPELASDFKKLSPREKDVLKQLVNGFLYKEIINNLGISTGTLNGYICSTYRKLKVHSRTEAVVKYMIAVERFKINM
jgi:DNA-binding NarL/FixJ family response regulator